MMREFSQIVDISEIIISLRFNSLFFFNKNMQYVRHTSVLFGKDSRENISYSIEFNILFHIHLLRQVCCERNIYLFIQPQQPQGNIQKFY